MKIRLVATVNGQEQVSVVDEFGFRSAFPETLFPASLTSEVVEPFGGFIVVETAAPVPALNQTVAEGELQLVDGLWHTTWVVADRSAEDTATVLANAQTAKWLAIKSQRDSRLLTKGVPVLVAGVTKGFETDVVNRTRYAQLSQDGDALIAAGGSVTDVIQANGAAVQWKTMDNSFVPMTTELVRTIIRAIADQEAAVFNNAEVLKTQMQALADPRGFDVMQGWPAVYEIQDLV